MRIAMISEHASPLATLGGVDAGGQNVYVAETAKAMARLGVKVDVFTRRDGEIPVLQQFAEGVRVLNVPAGPACFIHKEDMLGCMGEFADWTCAWARKVGGYDVVHANFFMSGLAACEIKRRLGIPFVITFHALGKVRRRHQGESDGFPDERFAIEERICAEADAIVAECPQDHDDLVELYGADPEKIRVVPCGFDPEALRPVDRTLARELIDLPHDIPVVLQLGRIVRRKGVENGVRGFAEYLSRAGTDARLLVVGGDADTADVGATPEIGRLASVAEDLGVADRVIFTGRRGRAALPYYYSAADVFVTTPWYEPFGITPLEAMACERPVIGSAVGGIKDTVVDGTTGVLVPAEDPSALSAALESVLSDAALAHRMGAEGRRRAEQRYTWETVARQLLSAYAGVTDGDTHHLAVTTRSADAIHSAFREARATFDAAEKVISTQLLDAGRAMRDALTAGCKVLACGNGGSAADAHHFVAELVGRFEVEGRQALPAISLSSDTSVMTAWSNDYGFDAVYSRQVEALGQPGDVLLAISTSGMSENICAAIEAARVRGMRTIALLGNDGGRACEMAEHAIVVPASRTARIQEVHGMVLHVLAEIADTVCSATVQGRPERLGRRLLEVV